MFMKKPDFDVIVIGGGPAGSTVASFLARKQRRVLILEKEKFPRYHVGESLVTGVVPILKELDLWEKVEAHGFTKKYGATFLWGNTREEPWSVFFDEAHSLSAKGLPAHTYQVVRSEFDEILLRHAESQGVDVREEYRVVKIVFEDGRCVGVKYQQPNGEVHEVRAHYTVDATGQSALLGRHLNTMEYDGELKNIAVWSYYKGAKRLEGRASGNILVEYTPDGWLWGIPLHGGKTSVGWVTPIENLKSSNDKDLESRYTQVVNNTLETRRLLDGAERTDKIYTIRDWSYQCKKFYGPGFLLVGDAAGFVDPLFSTGVFLAMNGGISGAKVLDQALANREIEERLFASYEYGYKQFLGIVASLVHYFYDASRDRESYFVKAQDLVNPIERGHARQDFIEVISGLAGLYPFEEQAFSQENFQLPDNSRESELAKVNEFYRHLHDKSDPR